MHKLISRSIPAALVLAMAGCGLVYKPTVNQGNLLDKKTVDQLKPGMTKRQVVVLMGSPSVHTPFQDNRWDYVATQQHRGGKMQVRTLTLTFANDALVRTEGDFFKKDERQLLQQARELGVGTDESGLPGDKGASPKGDKGGSR